MTGNGMRAKGQNDPPVTQRSKIGTNQNRVPENHLDLRVASKELVNELESSR
jgi:hypothetical protein